MPDFSEPDLTYPATQKLPTSGHAELVPYHGKVTLAGLIVEVTAPCGCIAYYNSEANFAREATLEPCGQLDCDFQWRDAERAAFIAAAG